MHELSLYGQLPESRHDQLLNIIAGVAAMQPQRVLQRYIIYKPTRDAVAPTRQIGGTQAAINVKAQAAAQQAQKDLFHLKLVQNMQEKENGFMHDDTWSIQFEDIPEPGARRQVTARLVNLTELKIVSDDGPDPQNYMKALGYTYVSEYLVEGYQVVHQNVVARLHRILYLPHPGENNKPLATRQPLRSLPPLSGLQQLDATGGYVLKASLLVGDFGKPDIVQKGTNELIRFKELLKGVVDMNPAERLSLDTRVKFIER